MEKNYKFYIYLSNQKLPKYVKKFIQIQIKKCFNITNLKFNNDLNWVLVKTSKKIIGFLSFDNAQIPTIWNLCIDVDYRKHGKYYTNFSFGKQIIKFTFDFLCNNFLYKNLKVKKIRLYVDKNDKNKLFLKKYYKNLKFKLKKNKQNENFLFERKCILKT